MSCRAAFMTRSGYASFSQSASASERARFTNFVIAARLCGRTDGLARDRKSTRLNSSHLCISYAVFCLKKKIHHKKIMIGNPLDYAATLGAWVERRILANEFVASDIESTMLTFIFIDLRYLVNDGDVKT